MTPEREAELFAKIDMLLDVCRGLQAEQERQAEALTDARIELGERIARVEGRIEEQSHTLQVALAGRLSRKPAA